MCLVSPQVISEFIQVLNKNNLMFHIVSMEKGNFETVMNTLRDLIDMKYGYYLFLFVAKEVRVVDIIK